MVSAANQVEPSNGKAFIKLGLNFENDVVKYKQLTNVHTFLTDATLSYKNSSKWAFGADTTLDLKHQSVPKYNFGFTWSPAENAVVQLRHDSLEDVEDLRIGKLYFIFFHKASATQTFGSEFLLNW